MIQQALDGGATLETGNVVKGNLLQPTVLSGVTDQMRIFKEEIFGPAVGLVPFSSDEHALQLVNATEFGLSGAIHTRDVYRGMTLARKMETGMVHINDQTANDEVHTPFGGVKGSGLGRFGGDFIMDELTTVQWVSVQHQPRVYPF
jgi:aldehyde dehydrogenase (NAD+)